MLGRENEYINEYFGGQYGPGFAWGASNVPVFRGVDAAPNYEVPDIAETPALNVVTGHAPQLPPLVATQTPLGVVVSHETQESGAVNQVSWIGPLLLVIAAIVVLK